MPARPRPARAPQREAPTPGKWVIEIEGWVPTTLNELLSVHWAARSRRKGADREWILIYCLKCGVPRAKVKRRVTLTITMEKGKRRPDPDAWWKSVLDALVGSSRLVDDGPKWVEIMPVEYRRGPEKATRIELEDIT